MSTKTHLQNLTYEKKPTRTKLRKLVYETHLQELIYVDSPTKTYSPRNVHLQKLIYEITPKRTNLREHTKKNKSTRTQLGKHIYEYSSTRYHL